MNYTKVKKSHTKAIKKLMKQQAIVDKMVGGADNIQSDRYNRDYLIASLLGVTYMNPGLHGWDGLFENGTPYENKNVKAESKSGASFALKFQDTSVEKLSELSTGVISATTFWKDRKPGFILLGNTRDVGELLLESYNPDTRRSSTVSMARCLNHGFKLVAVNYTKQQVLDTISSHFHRLGKNLTTQDIYNESDIKNLVAEMM